MSEISDHWYNIIIAVKAHSRLRVVEDIFNLVQETAGTMVFEPEEIEAIVGFIEIGKQRCMGVMESAEIGLKRCYEEEVCSDG